MRWIRRPSIFASRLFPWAGFRRTKAAVKLHPRLDLRGPIPSFVESTDGRGHEVNALDLLVLEPGAFSVMDRGDLDFARLHGLPQAGACFVIRAKRGRRFVRHGSPPVDPGTGVRSDQLGRLRGCSSRQSFPDKRRVVRFDDAGQDRRFGFLTPHLRRPALSLCQLDKRRWQRAS